MWLKAVTLILLLLALVGCASSTSPATPTSPATLTSPATPTETDDNTTLTEAEKGMAIEGIKGYEKVLDAAIKQEGRDLSLVVIVAFGTTEEQAKEMSDNFVRMVKSFGPDSPPGKEIGTGIFDYLIGVYYPNEALIAMGAKVRSSKHITMVACYYGISQLF